MGNKVCFIIGPIGEPGTEMRKHADQVYKHLVKPAAELHGLVVDRADLMDAPGMITIQTLQKLTEAEIVTADLSYANANAFYELAVRHVTRKPVVHLIRQGESIPFDVHEVRTVHFTLTDPDEVEKAREDLTKKIGAALTDERPTNPITVGLDWLTLKASQSTTDQHLANIWAALQGLQAATAEVRSPFAPRAAPPPTYVARWHPAYGVTYILTPGPLTPTASGETMGKPAGDVTDVTG